MDANTDSESNVESTTPPAPPESQIVAEKIAEAEAAILYLQSVALGGGADAWQASQGLDKLSLDCMQET